MYPLGKILLGFLLAIVIAIFVSQCGMYIYNKTRPERTLTR